MQWCSNSDYRDDLISRRYDFHVRDINQFVDRLRREHPDKFIPYVAPTYGGNNARLLALLQDPGPATNPEIRNGSEMLCIENDDGTANRYKAFLNENLIDVSDIQAWNAFPWYVSRPGRYQPGKPSQYPKADIHAATEALAELIDLMPKLHVVLLHGLVAQDAWGELRQRRPAAANRPKIVIDTYHPGEQAVDPDTKSRAHIQKIEGSLQSAFSKAGSALRASNRRPYDPWTEPPF